MTQRKNKEVVKYDESTKYYDWKNKTLGTCKEINKLKKELEL